MKKGIINVLFTGHRKLNDEYVWNHPTNIKLAYKIIDIVNELTTFSGFIKFGKFYFGGALGFDQLSFAVIHKNFPQIKKVLCVPFKNQYLTWNYEDQKRYIYQKGLADEIVYVDEYYKLDNISNYSKEKYQLRNQFMVDSSNYFIGYCNYKNSGTWNCIKYAKSKNVIGCNIGSYDII